MTMHEDHHVTVAFGLVFADPAIPWPSRGTGGDCLVGRDGWEPRTMPTVYEGRTTSVQAMCRGALGVNVMLDGPGFAVCLSANGWRISHEGRVFAGCEAAMVLAEAMLAADAEWDRAPWDGFTDAQRALLGRLYDDAERRGEIALDRVYPC